MPINYKEVGSRIRYRRTGMLLTQAQLAEMVGCSVQFLGHIERGTRKMSIETLVAISEALNLSTDYILKDNPSR